MKVTYRGVPYDTEARRAKPHTTHNVVETYRGVEHKEQVEVAK